MGFNVQKENDGKIATVRINQLHSNAAAANVLKNKHSKSHRGNIHSTGSPPARTVNTRRAPRFEESDSGSYYDDESSGDSDDNTFDQSRADPTIQALSNPNKTVSQSQVPRRQGQNHRAGSSKQHDFGFNESSESDGSNGSDHDFDEEDPSDNGSHESNGSNQSGRHTLKKSPRQPAPNSRSAPKADTFGNYSDPESPEAADSVEMSSKDVDKLKAELMSKFDRLQKKGVKVSKRFTMKSKLKDMQKEFERLNRNIEVDSAIKFQRKALIAILSGVEFLNKKFDPFSVKLEGWTESITNDITEYDNVFERLFDKYHGTAEMAPEIELIMMIAGSGLMFHMSKSLFNNANFNINDILKNNPDLMKSLMSQMQNPGAAGPANQGVPNVISGGNHFGVANPTNQGRSGQNTIPSEIIDDISERLSEASFDSDMTGIKSVNIRLDTVKDSRSPTGGKNSNKKQKKVLDIGLV